MILSVNGYIKQYHIKALVNSVDLNDHILGFSPVKLELHCTARSHFPPFFPPQYTSIFIATLSSLRGFFTDIPSSDFGKEYKTWLHSSVAGSDPVGA